MSTSKRRSPHSKVGPKKDVILTTEDVSDSEAMFALLYREGRSPVAHLIKVLNIGSPYGAVNSNGKEVIKTFLERISAE